MPRWPIVLLALVLLGAVARADKIDDLSLALRTDPSFRVKTQAAILLGKLKDPRGKGPLEDALKDDNETVRVVAAGALGKLGDPSVIGALRAAMDDRSTAVRTQAGKSIALLEKPTGGAVATGATAGHAGAGATFIEVSPINAGKGSSEAAARFHDQVARELGTLAGVTLDAPGGAARRFYVDGSITNLSSTKPDGEGHVRTDCDLRVMLATYPERSIKLMATVGGSTDGTADARDLEAARRFCLDDAAKQFAARVQTFLEGPH